MRRTCGEVGVPLADTQVCVENQLALKCLNEPTYMMMNPMCNRQCITRIPDNMAMRRFILNQEVASFVAQANSGKAPCLSFPVARVKSIMQESLLEHKGMSISHQAALSMTCLATVVGKCLAKLAWACTNECRDHRQSINSCVKLDVDDVISKSSTF